MRFRTIRKEINRNSKRTNVLAGKMKEVDEQKTHGNIEAEIPI